MDFRKIAVFNWSGGKDSALALQKIFEENEYEVVSLLTTIDEKTGASSMHAIPLELLKKQAESIGIPLYTISIGKNGETYEEGMSKVVNHFKEQSVTHFIFGDLYLSEVKSYRESKLNPLGIEVVEPLWGKTSHEVLDEFFNSGIKAQIIVTQADVLDDSFIGKDIDHDLIQLLPDGIDLCGENGEYHTFCYDGGPLKTRIDFEIINVNKISYCFKLDTGEMETYEYWQAFIAEGTKK
ncbi:MAG TPA: diphthine--ammonia ligase [Niabella sp.]|nr:diphthine--ammonia ligase [Niabella sp.]